MPVIVVANPKGGVGKSTLSTNLAGYFASQGHSVMLGDVDRQQSARTWLGLRPEQARPISSWDTGDDLRVRAPKGTTHMVLDTPGGLHGKRLDEVLKIATRVIVPLQPSIFDIHATHAFLAELAQHKRAGSFEVGLVGMRAREGTISADQLRSFLEGSAFPVLSHLRDTQNYIHLAAQGLTLWDVAPHRVERDLAQWQPITDWLNTRA
jgi:chromosome partitioning protein